MCGHPLFAHTPPLMSVPLLPRTPLYPLPPNTLNNGIHSPHPHATYEQMVCGCGCCSFEPLEAA